MLSLALLGTVVGVTVEAGLWRRTELSAGWWALIAVFILSALADFATTVWFMSSRESISSSIPGIRLFGYAYGRTVGPLAGKVVQAGGIVGLAVFLPRMGRLLLVIATIIYATGAAYNFWQM